MIQNIPIVANVLLVIVSLFRVTQGTVIEDFFRWMYLGSLLDFVYSSYAWIMSLLLIAVLFRWIKDWRILAGIGVVIFIFISYAF